MLVVALGAALTAFGGMHAAFADGGDDAPAAVADAPGPDTTLAEAQTGDEMLPDNPTADAMSAVRKGRVSLLSECRPDSTLVSIQTLLNPIDPTMSTLIVVTRGDSDRYLRRAHCGSRCKLQRQRVGPRGFANARRD